MDTHTGHNTTPIVTTLQIITGSTQKVVVTMDKHNKNIQNNYNQTQQNTTYSCAKTETKKQNKQK